MNAKVTFLAAALFASGCLFGGNTTPTGHQDSDTGISDAANNGQTGDGGTTTSSNNINPNAGLECGDGLLQPNELCDPAHPSFPCPDNCDDGVACTSDRMTGSEATCDVACISEPITLCESGDGCCPSDCTVDEDEDCDTSVVCGDGLVTGSETCDPSAAGAAACPMEPADCAVGACQRAIIDGDASTCNAVCALIAITICKMDDGCCPPSCDEATDNDCIAMCGDGVINPGELCDGNCPDVSSCDDGNACTTDGLQGSAATCDAKCTHASITMCINDDLCCPAQCSVANDNDCSATCGDGTVQPNETCDNGAGSTTLCPTNCNDMDSCTSDSSTGSPSNCNVVCANTPKNGCQADGCCVTGCNANNDPDCGPKCGNDAVEPPETCDGNCPANCDDGDVCTTDTATGSAAACSLVCSNAPITACVDGDGCCAPGCNSTNDDDCGIVCGNGIVEAPEVCDSNCPTNCDDGNACTVDVRNGSSASCNVTCSYSIVNSCGPSDGCCPAGCTSANDNDCSASCGNNVVETGETCDGNCPTSCPGPCLQLSGSASQCTAECTTIPGCVPCDLNGTCSCTAGEKCEGGRCQPSTGGECDQACNKMPYCATHASPGFICDLGNGSCVECLLPLHCAPEDTCLQGNYCGAPADCLDANDPDTYCQVYEGFSSCTDYGTYGLCEDTCSSNAECPRPESWCNAATGTCEEAPDCAAANDPGAWCENVYGYGDVCVAGVCYFGCQTPCDCPWTEYPQACVSAPGGQFFCAETMPGTCDAACADNNGADQDYYCEYKYGTGSYCDPNFFKALPDNCVSTQASADAGAPATDVGP